jgi:hypothetical protein
MPLAISSGAAQVPAPRSNPLFSPPIKGSQVGIHAWSSARTHVGTFRALAGHRQRAPIPGALP